ncbi:chemotaxis protein CheY [Oceanobacillus picturae]|jgi:two-component system, chemotaxis family, chemotaxis protein CheY|uniref:Chemotaxis protein CheY n=1 Tax=Oceanobacillus picturae TaxID=171693 RepID=A0A0U9H3U2_9BACI|nr:response regulator [Oceanobacillus picturae]RIU96271.1 response regulator [Oceanobacillus picturae]GAQ17354.1 chemotaxis protein CheY [Oceanobacillus picturae]
MARVMVVDDANFMRVTLSTILKKENHDIVGEAADGAEAVKLYKELNPDLVTMDITMPVMNGIDAIKEIKSYDPHATIIVCSAMGQQKVVVEAIESGAKDFIVKPFDDSQVLETVNRLVK